MNPRGLERWFAQARETVGLKYPGTPREAARRLGTKGAADRCVEALDPPARALLHLVCRVPRAVRRQDFDAAARVLFGDRAAEPLIDAGLVYPDGERMPRLHVPEPMRSRWRALAAAPASRPVEEPRPDASDTERADGFRFGLVLAAIEQQRPRVSGHVGLHQGDRAQLVSLVAAAFPAPADAAGMVDLALRHGLLKRHGIRWGVDFEGVDAADDLGARLATGPLEGADTRPGLLAVLATLTVDDRWHPLPVLLETAAAAMLDEPFAPGVGHELALLRDTLPRWPGVGAREHEGVVHLRLTELGRRALGLESPVPAHRKTLLVQPNLELVAQPGLDPRALARLGRVDRLTSVGGAAVLKLEEEAVRRAAAEGFDGEDMRSFLAAHSPRALPPNVVRVLADWAAIRGRARIVSGTVIVTDAGELVVRRALHGIEWRALGIGLWVVPSRKADAAARALAAAGLRCERIDAGDAPGMPATEGPGYASWRMRVDAQLARGRASLERISHG
ncbi:MAG: hypothetical protein RL199_2360 [Pseudomonadota bacterium]|jgi:hypothetical protein